MDDSPRHTVRQRVRPLIAVIALGCLGWALLMTDALASRAPERQSQAAPGAAPALPWQDCGGGVQCATMTVPVDWTRPAEPTTVLNLAKLPARHPQRRLGALIANFGAGNSTSVLHGPRPPVLTELTEWFDVVVFDPRGLGQADNGTLVRCPERPAPIDGLVLARTAADWQAHARANAAYDKSCREAAGAAYQGLTSWQIAHDLEAIRAALGEEKLRYFGNSYGTTYGQAYAELFPTRVARMYLDGVADHTQRRLEDWLRNYAITQERQLLRFRDWCEERGADQPAADGASGCPLYGSDAAKVWDELVARARRAPLPAPGAGQGRTVTVNQLFAGALVGMNPPRWPTLARAMAKARDGDASDFLTALAAPPPEAFGSVQPALLCHDFMPDLPDYREFLAIEHRLRRVAPRFGWIEGRYELGRCLGVGKEPAYQPHPLRAPGLSPVLVTIGEVDNTTANRGAAHLASQLPGGRALWHGDGHVAYLLGNRCLATHAHRYLTAGTLPPAGARCPAELLSQLPNSTAATSPTR